MKRKSHLLRLAIVLLSIAVVHLGCKRAAPTAPVIPKATAEDQTTASPPADSQPIKALGTFAVESGELLVSDPCYPYDVTDTGLSAKLEKVKRGTWKAAVKTAVVGDWGERCTMLVAFHQDHPTADAWVSLEEGIIGVDSGQAGIFDVAHYQDDSLVPKKYQWKSKDSPIDADQPWYSLCCDETLTDLGAGVIPYGVVSSSGYGDGGYDCAIVKDDRGEIIGVRIVFISDADIAEAQREEAQGN